MACLVPHPWTSCGLHFSGYENFRATRRGRYPGGLRSCFVAPCELRSSSCRRRRSGLQFVDRVRVERIRVVVAAGLIEKADGEQGVSEEDKEKEGSEEEQGDVELNVTSLGNNTRRVEAKIAIQAPLQAVWGVLTDYDHLADHIPGLAESRVVERRPNGARLEQIGQKNLAFGVKFKAKAIVEVTEEVVQDLDDGTLRDISFVTVEGDFNVFKGTWRMHQTCGSPNSELKSKTQTWLSYILEVQPKRWMPVGLIEGVLGDEITCNLISVRNVALRNKSN